MMSLICVLLLLAMSAWAQDRPRAFCIDAPHDQLCQVFPEDQTDFSRFFEYRVISASAQDPFDEYAWQAFVALNWDLVEPDSAVQVWRSFARKQDVLGGSSVCGVASKDGVVANIAQSDGNTLIDQDGNFIVYEIRMNHVARDYILSNGLNDPKMRARFTGPISFPIGRDAKEPASVLVKTAWRILEGETSGYVTASGTIPVPQDRSLDGKAKCLKARLGLVGMHVVAKVRSGHGDKWIWATFEHVANVPTARNARNVNSLYAAELFPDGCQSPTMFPRPRYILFDNACPECATNEAPPADVLWAQSPPYARHPDGQTAKASQVVRCWQVFGSTQATNTAWQTQLTGTPLSNYLLVSAQWRGANPDPIFEHGELPRYLSNTTMETYIQTARTGTCLGCHASASTPEDAPSDFTFLFRE